MNRLRIDRLWFGRLWIGRLRISRLRIGKLWIGRLQIGRLRIGRFDRYEYAICSLNDKHMLSSKLLDFIYIGAFSVANEYC